MRDAVTGLVAMGRLPDETLAELSDIDRRSHLLDEIARVQPSRAEIVALLDVFPADDIECLGLSWTLVHIIESRPDWPLWDALDARTGWWIDLLRLRLGNGRITRQSPE